MGKRIVKSRSADDRLAFPTYLHFFKNMKMMRLPGNWLYNHYSCYTVHAAEGYTTDR